MKGDDLCKQIREHARDTTGLLPDDIYQSVIYVTDLARYIMEGTRGAPNPDYHRVDELRHEYDLGKLNSMQFEYALTDLFNDMQDKLIDDMEIARRSMLK